MTLRFYFLILLFLLANRSLEANPNPGKYSKSTGKTTTIRYAQVKAKDGQGVYSILRKYQLLNEPSNVDLFYRINKLKKSAELNKNKTYHLPVLLQKYDGKSIQTSLKLKTKADAKQIEQYNQDLYNKNLRKSNYKQDGNIWVPILLEKKTINNSASPSDDNLQKISSLNPSTAKSDNDPRKQFLVASFNSKSDLVADHKLSADEIDLLSEKYNSNKTESKLGKVVSSKSVSVPLFGSRYERVDILTNELSDQIFYIVPGHGGPDPGAMAKNVDGKYTICEDEYAYDVSLRLAKNLMQKGATVYMIVEDKNDGIRDEMYLDCDKDEKCIGGHTIPCNQKKRLKQGISKVNKLFSKHKKHGIKKQWMVSLHIDSQGEESRQDVYFYYQSESATSKEKALDIQKVFEEKYEIYRKDESYKGTVSSRPLYVVRNSDPEPIFIELANIHNEQDRKRILFPKNRQLLAEWITEGFLK